MTVIHLLAHCDDEFAALPLIRQYASEGRRQRFIYLTTPKRARMAARRLAESRAFLADLGIPSDDVIPLGQSLGVLDGALKDSLVQTFAALAPIFTESGGPSVLMTPAWEGGHVDHDLCAVLAAAVALSGRRRCRLQQFSLYHGRDTFGPLFSGAAPLAENGPVARIAMTPGDWLRYGAAVRFYPSQAHVWSTLAPAMALSFARRGFGVQRLDPMRVLSRPHRRALLYERRGRGAYDDVARRVEAFLAGLNPPAIEGLGLPGLALV